MKEKIKVFLKKLKNILPLLLACLLVGAMVLGLYVFSQSKQLNTLSASADEATTVADIESGLDLTQYPSANLLPLYDVEDNLTVNGVNFSVDPQTGIVLESGTATKEIWLRVITSGTLKAGTYTLSGCPVDGWYTRYRLAIQVTTSAGKAEYFDQGKSKTFTVEEDCTYILYLFVANGYTVDNLVFKPMLNVGDVAYPFIPSLERIYNNAYTSGYNQGKEEGLDYARAGYWLDVTVGVDFAGTSNGVEVSDNLVIHPTVTSMGIDLSNVYTEINAKYPDLVLRRCMFALYFPECVIVENLKLRCIGDEGILTDDQLYCYLYDFGTDEYEGIRARFAYIDGSSTVAGLQFAMSTGTEAELEELNSKRLCYISSSAIQNISQFKGLRFYTVDTLAGINYEAGRVAGYNAGSKESYEAGKAEGFELGKEEGQSIGFEAGKTEGFELGKEEGFKTGKSEGYESGKDDGYNKGLKEGELIGREKAISEGVDGSGLLYALFALLKLFFTLLSDMMSLKIAGDFTVGFFVIGIPATFMIINLVIKLVNRSSGGSE